MPSKNVKGEQQKNAEIFDMKAALKNKDKFKNSFYSYGYSEIKVTKDGVPETKKIKIFAINTDHPIIQEFIKQNPMPKPPVVKDYVNQTTGKSLLKDGLNLADIKNKPGWTWEMVYDRTDENYEKEINEWNNKITLLQMMVIFDVVDEFGIDKLDEFTDSLKNLGMTANQVNKLAADIKNLDSM
ncbi:MAG: hypothetical protein PWQ45_96 [Thermosipho sp. (in: thermotogales)]|jgi:hypothetical protein|nr:hypothetical protein [Thermosipho sp. (in: thermotogales)]